MQQFNQLLRTYLIDRSVMRSALGIDDDVPTMIYVGRLEEEKGVNYLLDASAMIDE